MDGHCGSARQGTRPRSPRRAGQRQDRTLSLSLSLSRHKRGTTRTGNRGSKRGDQELRNGNSSPGEPAGKRACNGASLPRHLSQNEPPLDGSGGDKAGPVPARSAPPSAVRFHGRPPATRPFCLSWFPENVSADDRDCTALLPGTTQSRGWQSTFTLVFFPFIFIEVKFI